MKRNGIGALVIVPLLSIIARIPPMRCGIF